MKTNQTLETEAAEIIALLHANGNHQEASRLGQLVGQFRKCRIGQSLLSSGIRAARKKL